MKTAILGAAALCTVLVGGAASARVIGPDAFGYTATDEVPFSFTDIRSTGTLLFNNVDDGSATASIGFDFSLYGQTYSSAFVSTNGILTFGAANSANFLPGTLSTTPVTGAPVLAPYWDDLAPYTFGTPPSAYQIHTQTLGAPGSRQFIVQWTDAYFFAVGTNNPVTFQAVLIEGSNDLRFNYLDLNVGIPGIDGADIAHVGIADGNGPATGNVLEWTNPGTNFTIADQSSILFDAPAIVAVPEPTMLTLLVTGLAGLGPTRRRKAVND